jgi:hypothetical protein
MISVVPSNPVGNRLFFIIPQGRTRDFLRKCSPVYHVWIWWSKNLSVIRRPGKFPALIGRKFRKTPRTTSEPKPGRREAVRLEKNLIEVTDRKFCGRRSLNWAQHHFDSSAILLFSLISPTRKTPKMTQPARHATAPHLSDGWKGQVFEKFWNNRIPIIPCQYGGISYGQKQIA